MLLSFNRTLWNWNIGKRICLLPAFSLLIVPYGIETIKKYGKDKIVELLIVPYGIETFQPEFANIGFQPF